MREMLRSVLEQAGPALQARVVLLVNHVLSRESAATGRLRAHAGARVRIEAIDEPKWWPMPLAASVRISPAGLFELDQAPDSDEGVALRLRIRTPTLGQLLAALSARPTPEVELDGDAALAADMLWLVENLRWDLEAELAQLVGPMPAHQLVAIGRSIALALRGVLTAFGAERR